MRARGAHKQARNACAARMHEQCVRALRRRFQTLATHTDRQTERERDIHTYIQKDRQTHTHMHNTTQVFSYPYYRLAPLFVYGLIARTIKQTSEFPGATNTISAIMSVSITQEPQSKITISGLVPTQTPSGVISVTDLNNTGVFIVSGSGGPIWYQDTGTLVVPVQAEMEPGVVYTLSWQITNPTAPQDAPDVKVETNGPLPDSNFPESSMQHGEFNTAALLIIGWDVAKIGQSTPAVSTANTITVTFSTYGSFVVNQGRSLLVSISGLVESSTPSGIVEVMEPKVYDDYGVDQDTGNDDMLAAEGLWNQTTGTIVVTVINTTEAHVEYVFSFVITNPGAGQESPSQLNISAEWPIPAMSMTPDSGVTAPLLIHSFLTRYIEQNDPGAGANNTFELFLTSRSHLPSSPSDMTVVDPGDDYIAGDLIVSGGNGSEFRAAFTVVDRAINGTRVLSLGEGYDKDASLIPVYSGTRFVMGKSVTVAQVVTPGRNYVISDIRAMHPISGSDFLGQASVNETDGAMTAIKILNHGRDYGDAGFLSFTAYYPGTNFRMENSITGLNPVSLAGTSNCRSGMIISAVGGGGQHFRAVIDLIQLGQISSWSILHYGTDYTSDPQLIISSATCLCNGLPGNVAGNFDSCLTPRRAHGATIGLHFTHAACIFSSVLRCCGACRVAKCCADVCTCA